MSALIGAVLVGIGFTNPLAAQTFCVAGLSDGPSGILLVRSSPSQNASSLFHLVNGDCVEIVGERGDYYAIRYRGLSGWVARRYVVEKTAAKVDDKVEWIANDGKVRRADTDVGVRLGEKLDPSTLRKRFPGMRVNITRGEDCWVCGSVTDKEGGGFSIDWDNDNWVVTRLEVGKGSRSGDVTIGRRLVDVVGSGRVLECDQGDIETCRSPFDPTVHFVLEGDCELVFLDGESRRKARAPHCKTITGFVVRQP